MNIKSSKLPLLWLVVLLTMIMSLVFPTAAFADDGPATPEPTVEPVVTDPLVTEEPVEEVLSTEEPVIEDLVDAQATGVPADTSSEESSVALVVDAMSDAGAVVLDESGQLVSLASQEAAQLLADPDPYIVRGGVTYGFTAADCDPTTIGAQPCTAPIQAAINFANAGEIVYVEAGTYNESPNINKSLTLQSTAGRDATIINLQAGPTYLGALSLGGAGASITIDGFTIVGFDAVGSGLASTNIFLASGVGNVTITNNRIQVGNIGANSNGDDGIGLLTTYNTSPANDVTLLTVTNNIFEPLNDTATRAFYVNPGVEQLVFEDNEISGNFTRTAITQARDGTVAYNTVTGSGSSAGLGTWGYPDPNVYGRTTFSNNTIIGTGNAISIFETNNVTVQNNVIDGNGTGVRTVDYDNVSGLNATTVTVVGNSLGTNTIADVSNGYSIGTINASGNWWGTYTPANVAGSVFGSVDYTPWLNSGTDTDLFAPGFQGDFSVLNVDGDSPQTGTEGRIQEAIDTVSGSTINVYPGEYSEKATNRWVLGTNGPHQFGLFFDEDGVTVRGVDASGVPITDYHNILAYVSTNATNNFGYSGIFVEGDNVTISGLEIGANAAGDNKTIEVIGNNFTLLDSSFAIEGGGSLYFNDWRFNTSTGTSYVQGYHVEGNFFNDGTSIDIASGAGYSGPVTGRVITGNVFVNSYYWPSISFNGSGTGVPWFVDSVGGAVITNNTFINTYNAADNTSGFIRARGTYDNSQFDWASYWCDNTYDDAAIVTTDGTPANIRTYSYPGSYGTFNNVRRIGGDLQGEQNHAQAGDVVLSWPTPDPCAPPTPMGGGNVFQATVTSTVPAVIPVTGGQEIVIPCDQPSVTFLVERIEVTFTGLCGYSVALEPILEEGLPGDLGDGNTFAAGISILLIKNGQAVETLPPGASLRVSYARPAGADVSITVWNGSSWDEIEYDETDTTVSGELSGPGSIVMVTH